MPNFNRENIDRKTNKPNPIKTEGLQNDRILNRAEQTRRDDDVIRTPKRTPYDIDYAIKWYIENEIRPQVTDNGQILTVPVIFANGEKWDNVRRLGYLRDEKGMLQSPIIMLKRNSIVERDMVKGLDVNHTQPGSHLIYRSKYNSRNRFEDSIFPIPTNQPASSEQLYVIDIPKYVTIEYDIMLWCDFTTQMNELVDQIMPYGRFAWGNETNKFPTTLGQFSFETVNTVGEDRLVRSTNTLTVQGTLLSEQETRIDTLKKMYSLKKVVFEVTVTDDIFQTTAVPNSILTTKAGTIIIDNIPVQISPQLMNYLINLTEKQATYVNATTVTVTGVAGTNPLTFTSANINEFDIFINGQYIDKVCYTWTPSNTTATQTIIFDTVELGYNINVTDLIIVKGRWA
jgi:hypothetical protein